MAVNFRNQHQFTGMQIMSIGVERVRDRNEGLYHCWIKKKYGTKFLIVNGNV